MKVLKSTKKEFLAEEGRLFYNLFCSDYLGVHLRKPIDLVITSPPYNIGSASPKKITNRKFGGYDSKSWGSIEDYPDNLPEDEYQKQQYDFLCWCGNHIKNTGNVIYNHKPRHKNGSLILPTTWFPNKDRLTLREVIIWDRKSTHNHTQVYTYDHYECLYVFSKPQCHPYFLNQDFFWKEQKNRGVSNVWSIPRAKLNGHNCPFPLKMIRQIIRMWSPEGGIICDPYSGSGTTMLATYLEKRSFVGTEYLDKYYKKSYERILNYGKAHK